MAIDGDARVPAGAAILLQRLDEPIRTVEPGVLQVPVLPVVECDVGPVRAVDRDGYRGSDLVAALVVDGGLRPCGLARASLSVLQGVSRYVEVRHMEAVRRVDCQ